MFKISRTCIEVDHHLRFATSRISYSLVFDDCYVKTSKYDILCIYGFQRYWTPLNWEVANGIVL